MTVSLIAVFIPLVFMGGIVGRLLHEFAVTIMLAILVSGIVSVTLTPMLCARILKRRAARKAQCLLPMERAQLRRPAGRLWPRSLRWSMAHKRAILALFAISIAASVILFDVMPEDFLPADDTGMLVVSIQAANGTSYERVWSTTALGLLTYSMRIRMWWQAPCCGLRSNGAGANGANISIMLKPLSERALSAEDVARELRRKVTNITGINVFVQVIRPRSGSAAAHRGQPINIRCRGDGYRAAGEGFRTS